MATGISAFQLWFQEKRKEIKGEAGDGKLTVADGRQKWKAMSGAEKAVWENKAKEAQEHKVDAPTGKRKAESDGNSAEEPPVKIAKRDLILDEEEEPSLPVKVPSAFLLWASENRKDIIEELGDEGKGLKAPVALHRKWSLLSPAEKAPFEKQSLNELEKSSKFFVSRDVKVDNEEVCGKEAETLIMKEVDSSPSKPSDSDGCNCSVS